MKQTLRWRLACRIFIREGFWIDICEREGTEAGLGRERSCAMIQFQWKVLPKPARNSEAERGPRLSWVGGEGLYTLGWARHWGPRVGHMALGTASLLRQSSTWRRMTAKSYVSASGGISPFVWEAICVGHHSDHYRDSADERLSWDPGAVALKLHLCLSQV